MMAETVFYFRTNYNALRLVLNFLANLKINEAVHAFFGDTAFGVLLGFFERIIELQTES